MDTSTGEPRRKRHEAALGTVFEEADGGKGDDDARGTGRAWRLFG